MLRTKVVAIITSSRPFIQTAEATLQSEGHLVEVFESLKEALAACQTRHFDAVILDVSARPPRDETSLSRLSQQVGAHRIWLAPPLGLSPWVQDAETLGIHHFLKAPVQRPELEEMLTELSQLAEEFEVTREVDHDVRPTAGRYHLEEIGHNRYFLAASPAMMRIYENIRLLAAVDVPVLILGESGVGKDVVANLLHKHSRRSSHVFSSVNCAALPPDLLESELFGYEAGAFTGAVKAKPGKFELADRGTLLLDEIGEMSAPMQAKLLHVLQDGRYSRLGARTVSTADVRVIAATNVNIENAISDKLFREDLYYRISAFTINIPPLRERREEIPFLVEQMVKRQAAQFQQDPVYISPRIVSLLQEYHWPGNLRELSNAVIRIQILKGSDASVADIESKVMGRATITEQVCPTVEGEPDASVTHMRSIVRNFKDQTESRLIQQALEAARWNRRHAAAALRISYRTLLYKIDQYHLKEARAPMRFSTGH